MTQTQKRVLARVIAMAEQGTSPADTAHLQRWANSRIVEPLRMVLENDEGRITAKELERYAGSSAKESAAVAVRALVPVDIVVTGGEVASLIEGDIDPESCQVLGCPDPAEAEDAIRVTRMYLAERA